MAGDWIKIRVGLRDEPEVVAMALELNMEADLVVGKLARFWEWADQHTVDGVCKLCGPEFIEELVERRGFADALARVGWLVVGDGFEIPQFSRWLGNCARRRKLEAERKRKKRAQGGPCQCPMDIDGTSHARASPLISSSSSSEEEKTQDYIRGGGPGVGEALELRLEGRYDPATGSLLDEIRKWTRCGERKAEAIYLGLREPKAETLAAWKAYARKHGKPDAVGSMQTFDHPSEVPHEPETEDPSGEPDRESRVAAVLRRYPRPKKSAPSDLAPLHEYVAKRVGGNGNGKEHA